MAVHTDLLSDKKVELEDLRKDKVKGQMKRTRLQWLHEGEKPTSFFCNLERKQYIEKTIKKINLTNGRIIMDQYKILDEIQNFYSNLFKNCDETLNDKNIPNLLKPLNFNKINDPDLGQAISVEELANVLKK